MFCLILVDAQHAACCKEDSVADGNGDSATTMLTMPRITGVLPMLLLHGLGEG